MNNHRAFNVEYHNQIYSVKGLPSLISTNLWLKIRLFINVHLFCRNFLYYFDLVNQVAERSPLFATLLSNKEPAYSYFYLLHSSQYLSKCALTHALLQQQFVSCVAPGTSNFHLGYSNIDGIIDFKVRTVRRASVCWSR